ncbi:MAG: MFS transporter [Gammaproteobacteria bacterium]|nr:MFS transporter [Gammaproteobacteria bacterium]
MLNRHFFTFFYIQFLGAFNDNIYKNILVLLIVFQGISLGGLNSQLLVTFSFAIFILPFFIFSALAGQLADKFNKNRLVIFLKLLELVIMSFAVIALMADSYYLLLLLLFLMGTQSAFFGPIKYSIIPDLIRTDKSNDNSSSRLLMANGWVEMGTFVAILLGTIVAGFLVSDGQSLQFIVSLTLLGVSLIGFFISLYLPFIEAKDPKIKIDFNPLTYSYHLYRVVKETLSVYHVVILISLFWFLGACILSQMPNWGKQYLYADEQEISFLLFAFTAGIGIGSMICRYLNQFFSTAKINLIGTFGLIVTLLLFIICSYFYINLVQSTQFESGTMWLYVLVILSLFMMGFFGGLYIVPLYTFLQVHVKTSELSRNIAYTNILNAIFMVASALLIMFLQIIDFSLIEIFLIVIFIFVFIMIFVYRANKKIDPGTRLY